jgi:hypothetical protein
MEAKQQIRCFDRVVGYIAERKRAWVSEHPQKAKSNLGEGCEDLSQLVRRE